MKSARPSGQGAAPVSQLTILGIQQIKIPVTDLARSVEWYSTLLELELHREFVEAGELAGAVMAHPGGFVLSVRLRGRVPGKPSFAGFDLFSLGVASRYDLETLASRAILLGSEHGDIVDRGVDGYHLDIADPDGVLVRFLAPADTGADAANPPAVDGTKFVGVSFDDDGAPSFYTTPRLKPS